MAEKNRGDFEMFEYFATLNGKTVRYSSLYVDAGMGYHSVRKKIDRLCQLGLLSVEESVIEGIKQKTMVKALTIKLSPIGMDLHNVLKNTIPGVKCAQIL